MNPLEFPLPKKMKHHTYEQSVNFSTSACDKIWDKLQRRETFAKGQIPPYQVEFESGVNTGEFKEGELNIHHGPFLSAHGIIGEVTSNYRDLKYSYGSYVITFRLVRPVRLEFFRKENTITLKFSCQVRNWFAPIWHFFSLIFWGQFAINLKLISLFYR